jgi:hypothetical protein
MAAIVEESKPFYIQRNSVNSIRNLTFLHRNAGRRDWTSVERRVYSWHDTIYEMLKWTTATS